MLKNKNFRHNLYVNIFFVLIAIIFTMVFAKTGSIVMGDDALWHLNRISEFINAIHNHNDIINLYSFASFANVGSAVQNFYPNILLFPFAIFFYFTHSLVMSFYLGVILFTYLTLSIGYYCFKNFSGKISASLLFTILYTFSNYRLTNIFIRFAVGEWIAMTFFPIVILGLYKLFVTKQKIGSYLLAAGIGLILYSHVLSGFIAIGLVILTWLISLVVDYKNWRQATINCIKSGILVLIVALPLFSNLIKLKGYIVTPTAHQLVQGSIPIKQLIDYNWHNYIGIDTGFVSIVIIIGFVFLVKRAPKIYVYAYILMLVSIFVTTNLFPWAIFQKTPITIIQFPSRFLVIANIFIAITGAYVFENVLVVFKRYHWWGLFIILAAILSVNLRAEQRLANARFATYQQITTVQPTNVSTIVINDKTMPIFLNYLRTVGNLQDYWPKISFNHRQSIANQIILSKDNTVKFIKMPIQQYNIVKFSVVNSGKSQMVDLPILNYKNQYQFLDNGKEKNIHFHNEVQLTLN